jgi:hypothetical protein
MENEYDSVMSKILDPMQFNKQKIFHKQLRNEKKELQDKKFHLTDDLMHKEAEDRTKEKLQINSSFALVGYLSELKHKENNVKSVSILYFQLLYRKLNV